MNGIRSGLGAALACALTAAIVLLSDLTYVAEASDDALLRLSWRAVGERTEECRIPTAAELEALPLHMRRKEICEGRLAPFRLVVEVDGEELIDTSIRASGARQDRPTYVYHEFRLPPGRRDVRVDFRVDRPEDSDPNRFAPLVFDDTLELAPRTIALVTHREGDSALSVVLPAGDE